MTGSSYFVLLCIAVFMHEQFPRIKAEYNRVHEGLQRTGRLPAREVLSEDITSQNKWKDRAPEHDYIRDIQAAGYCTKRWALICRSGVLPYLKICIYERRCDHNSSQRMGNPEVTQKRASGRSGAGSTRLPMRIAIHKSPLRRLTSGLPVTAKPSSGTIRLRCRRDLLFLHRSPGGRISASSGAPDIRN
jgi:hypothetical protein